MIRYFCEDIRFTYKNKLANNRWLKMVAGSEIRKIGDINVIFCSDNYILDVNMKYLQHDYFTDIITFDYDEGDVINGDLVISLDTVKSNAEMLGKSYEEELYRVIIHGILHLCGINDKGPGEREIMEAAENKALAIRPMGTTPKK